MDLSLLKSYALSFIGSPYHFGGDDPISGFDCSGLASELLRAAGLVPYNFRSNAQGIYNLFEHNSSAGVFALGTLAFYGENLTKIDHIAFCLDSFHMIEAGGGDSSTVNDEVASQRNAFVRLRPIKYRKDFLTTLKPYYPNQI